MSLIKLSKYMCNTNYDDIFIISPINLKLMNYVIDTSKFINKFGQPSNPLLIGYFKNNNRFTPSDLCEKIMEWIITVNSIKWCDFCNDMSPYINTLLCFATAFEYTGLKYIDDY